MPQSKRLNAREQSRRIAYCGVATGLSIVLMLLGGLIPAATYCVPLLCGFILMLILAEFGKRAAWCVWGATSLLALIIDTDREAALFYFFLACWPLIKFRVDRIRSKPLRILVKLLYFNAAYAVIQLLLGVFFGFELLRRELFGDGWWFFVLLMLLFNLCMFLYDRLLIPLYLVYINRFRQKLFRR